MQLGTELMQSWTSGFFDIWSVSCLPLFLGFISLKFWLKFQTVFYSLPFSMANLNLFWVLRDCLTKVLLKSSASQSAFYLASLPMEQQHQGWTHHFGLLFSLRFWLWTFFLSLYIFDVFKHIYFTYPVHLFSARELVWSKPVYQSKNGLPHFQGTSRNMLHVTNNVNIIFKKHINTYKC